MFAPVTSGFSIFALLYSILYYQLKLNGLWQDGWPVPLECAPWGGGGLLFTDGITMSPQTANQITTGHHLFCAIENSRTHADLAPATSFTLGVFPGLVEHDGVFWRACLHSPKGWASCHPSNPQPCPGRWSKLGISISSLKFSWPTSKVSENVLILELGEMKNRTVKVLCESKFSVC